MNFWVIGYYTCLAVALILGIIQWIRYKPIKRNHPNGIYYVLLSPEEKRISTQCGYMGFSAVGLCIIAFVLARVSGLG